MKKTENDTLENGEEEYYYHWLYQIPGIGKISLKKALLIMTPQQIFEEGTEMLRDILSEKQCSSIEQNRNMEKFLKDKEQLIKDKIYITHFGGEGYPKKLLHIPDPPLILYCKGKKGLWDCPAIAVVGARNCSSYGKIMAKELGIQLARNGIITVSGMAKGIDGICQWHTLEAKEASIAVLGSGVQVCYPAENYSLYERLQKEGCLISEYPPYTKPAQGLFPPRNRIISGLADILVVIEAREKSGTLITVDMALEQGKEVYCIPGRTTDDLSRGCNQLIKMGAGIILSVSEFVEEICLEQKRIYHKTEILEKEIMGTTEEAVLKVLDSTPSFVEEIYENIKKGRKDMTLQNLMDILLELQLKGRVFQQGQYYYKE